MEGMVQKRTAATNRREKKEQRAGPRTRIGKDTRRECRLKDLVHVADPRDDGQEFTATVVGAYTLDQKWHVQLAPPPSGPPQRFIQPIPRQSTPLKNVKTVYRRQS